LIKKITTILGTFALLGLATIPARAEIIFAPDFPVNGVPASEIPPKAMRAFLLAAFDKDVSV